MLKVSTDTVPNREIVQVHGLVSGSIVQSKNAFKDIGAGLKSLVGGELKSYSKLLDKARDEALADMEEKAKELGANAITAVRISSGQIAGGAAEIYAYGTAVTIASP